MNSFFYKNLTDRELVEIFSNYKFKISLRKQQLISLAFIIGENLDSAALWLPVRSGKTIMALTTLQLWGCKKVLIVVPNSAIAAWEKDIPVASDYTFEVLTGSRSNRINKLRETNRNIYIINYEGLKSIYGYLGSDGWVIDHDSFIDEFDAIVYDEVHHCNDYGAIQSGICFELSKRAKYHIGLSADPINKHYLELFNIYKIIDLGKSLGLNFFAYRSAYFKSHNRTNRSGKSWKEWKLKKEKEGEIIEKISGCSISFDRSECSDVPENEPVEIEVETSDEFLKLQKDIIDGKSIDINGKLIDCSTVGIKGQKLLQLSSGFLYYGKENEHEIYRLKDNPKLKALIGLVKRLDDKVIIFHRHVDEAHFIEEALTQNSIKFVPIRGEIKRKKKETITEFTDNSEIKVLLVQQSASEGYDAKAAKYVIFYYPIASPRLRNQCEGRIKGEGQSNDYVIYDLIMKDSFDKVVNKNLKKNKSFSQSVMQFIRGYNK